MLVGVFVVAILASASPAGAAIPGSLHDPANCEEATAGPLDYWFCDDDVPFAGGLVPNLTGASAITVPAKYGGDGFTGLPAKAADAATMPGANPADGTIGLDVSVTLPRSAPPAGGYPLLFFMHGCCGGNKTGWTADSFDASGEEWHYSNAWFASRGYVVVNYTARGFVSNQNRGSTGQTQLDSRRFEINDYQHLACQLYANASGWNDVTSQTVAINPQKVVATGGSYGGGFTWLAFTDPKWSCNPETGADGTAMSLAAAAPKYGWTDIVYTLVPNGLHSQSPGELPSFDGCSTGPRTLSGDICPGGGAPVGTAKQSIVAGLFAAGNLLSGDHTTFPPTFPVAVACLQGAYPYEASPLCATTLGDVLPEFLSDRSAYYQNDFFAHIGSDPSYRVPIFNAATFTDPLFPPYEDRRMANRLLETVPGYPIQIYHGDYQHFVQNKAKEWGDLCGADRHVCGVADYPNGGASASDFNADPATLARQGITTRLTRFLDHYAQPSANAAEPQPAFDVTADLQVCPDTAADFGVSEDEPGLAFTAPTFEELAPNTLSVDMPGAQTTLSAVPGNTHAINADPVFNDEGPNDRSCVVESSVAGPGVGSYSSEPLPSDATMVGSTQATVDFALTGPSDGLQLNARLYDVLPSGEAVLVDRGTRVLTDAEASAGEVTFGLHSNGWRFREGHRVRIELAQDDSPFVHATTVPSSLALSAVELAIPIREGDTSIGGGPDARPSCGHRIDGTKRRDRLDGSEYGDLIRGKRGNDRLRGLEEDDCLRGGAGSDRETGGPGADKIVGGRGNDRLKARDGERDRVRCGKGKRDRAKVDRRDRVRGCERVRGP